MSDVVTVWNNIAQHFIVGLKSILLATTVLNEEFCRCFIVAGFLFRSTLLAVSNGVVWVAGQVFPAINADECCLEFCDCDDSNRVEICGVIIVIEHGHFK